MRTARREAKPAAGSSPPHPQWSELLVDAVNKPGVISAAYSRFWNYSIGNQLLAHSQCMLRGIDPGPIHTFAGWKEVGRSVKKGEKAITLCMPVTKRKLDANQLDLSLVRVGDGAERQLTGPGGVVPQMDAPVAVTVFTYKPHWFVLAQTEGADYVPAELPQWSEEAALKHLLIDRARFDHPNGNCQGYASGRSVAVSPVAVMPHKTLFHELAHVLLGHTAERSERLDDHDLTPKNLREAEAECVALICCESLGLGGADFCRGYIQHWLGRDAIPERSAQKIFRVSDQILKAGREAEERLPRRIDGGYACLRSRSDPLGLLTLF